MHPRDTLSCIHVARPRVHDISRPRSQRCTERIVDDIVNSVISTLKARFGVLDIGNFYLGTDMKRYEYMFINMSDIPDDIVQKYNLKMLAKNEKVYVEIRKGMYGLPQAGILANELLQKNLMKHGYAPYKHTPGLWTHKTRPIRRKPTKFK